MKNVKEYRNRLCLILIFINLPYYDQYQSPLLGYHTKRTSKEKLKSKNLLKHEICLNQAYFSHVLYIKRLQTLYKKTAVKKE